MQRIFLTGLPGSGKSTIGPLLAALLGWDFADTDDLLSERSGLPVGLALVEYGEQKFRQLESEILVSAATQEHIVIATGGGAVIAEANRTFMQQHGLVVYLQVSVETAWQRVQEHLRQSGTAALRPLLAGIDGQQRLQHLYVARKAWYEQAAASIDTNVYPPDILARQVVAYALVHGYLNSHQHVGIADVGAQFIAPSWGADPGIDTDEGAMHCAPTSAIHTQAVIEWGGLHRLPSALQSIGLSQRVFIVTDTDVGRLYSEPVRLLLEGAGCIPHLYTIPTGESSKSLFYFQHILDWLVAHKAERQEPVVALGGGVVGDLAGFVAACYQRGVPFIQVPTSLLAQVDAAIGGKTGINHALGKNLIGAFYQPRLILVDPALLLTLPERVYREGWAEIVKYGMILDAALFELLEAQCSALHARDATILSTIITRCVQLKMEVVERDERDEGLRNILNYGHTFGHALETLTAYQTLLHGEAVAIGMEVAARIAVSHGLLPGEDALRQRRLLQALDLPVSCPGVDTEAVLAAMQRDKKVRAGRVRWVLPANIGQAGVYDDIPLEVVQDAVTAVCSAPEGETC